MKELNRFRQFISEEKDEKVSEDKIEAAIKATLEKEGGAAGIDPLKKAVKDLDVDTDFDIEKFLKKMSNVEKHKNGDYILTPLKEGAYGDGSKDPFDSGEEAEGDNQEDIEESSLKEGTWSYGSENQMIKALEEMNAMMMHSDPRQFKAGIEAMEKALYKIFGSDDFHDYLGNAQDFAAEGDLDRAKNALTDAMGIGDRMLRDFHGMEGDIYENDKALDEIINEAKPNLKKALPTIAARNVERNNAINFDIEEMMDMVGQAGKGEKSEEAQILFKASNASSDLEQALTDLQMSFEDDLEENDKALDEIIGEEKEEIKEGLFDEIDMMLDKLAVHMSAEETLRDLMGEFEAISGGPKVLHMALKNLMMGAGLMEEKDEE